MTFAEKIKKLRKILGVTQVKLASLIKSSQGSIACWETGAAECRPDKLDVLEKLCVKRGIRINWRK